MDKLLPVLLLLGVGAFGIGCGAIGLRTGTAMTFYRHTRTHHPGMFWYSTVFQFGIGAACLVMALVKAIE